ncbi:hypothetical protein HK101_007511 [Irineochytrium annulatum]|nr:hypothetical protein HK101_007511 [Irineochytrium annulatum]
MVALFNISQLLYLYLSSFFNREVDDGDGEEPPSESEKETMNELIAVLERYARPHDATDLFDLYNEVDEEEDYVDMMEHMEDYEDLLHSPLAIAYSAPVLPAIPNFFDEGETSEFLKSFNVISSAFAGNEAVPMLSPLSRNASRKSSTKRRSKTKSMARLSRLSRHTPQPEQPSEKPPAPLEAEDLVAAVKRVLDKLVAVSLPSESLSQSPFPFEQDPKLVIPTLNPNISAHQPRINSASSFFGLLSGPPPISYLNQGPTNSGSISVTSNATISIPFGDIPPPVPEKSPPSSPPSRPNGTPPATYSYERPSFPSTSSSNSIESLASSSTSANFSHPASSTNTANIPATSLVLSVAPRLSSNSTPNTSAQSPTSTPGTNLSPAATRACLALARALATVSCDALTRFSTDDPHTLARVLAYRSDARRWVGLDVVDAQRLERPPSPVSPPSPSPTSPSPSVDTIPYMVIPERGRSQSGGSLSFRSITFNNGPGGGSGGVGPTPSKKLPPTPAAEQQPLIEFLQATSRLGPSPPLPGGGSGVGGSSSGTSGDDGGDEGLTLIGVAAGVLGIELERRDVLGWPGPGEVGEGGEPVWMRTDGFAPSLQKKGAGGRWDGKLGHGDPSSLVTLERTVRVLARRVRRRIVGKLREDGERILGRVDHDG